MSYAGMFTSHMTKTNVQAPPPVAQQANSVTRTLLVRIEGDRTTWDAQGINGAMWRLNQEHASTVFHSGKGKEDPQQQQERLNRAMIRRVTVLETQSNINEAVAMTIDGLPCKEFTEAGDGAHLFLCCAGHCETPKEVYNICGNTELGMAWMQNYPKHTVQNLDKEGVVQLPNKPFVFVEEKHPVLAYMKIILPPEQFLLLVDMDAPGVDGQGWMRVSLEDFKFYASDIRDHVLRDAPSTFDLSTLTVRIRRPNGAKWYNVTENETYNMVDGADPEQSLEALVKYMDKPLQFTMRLEIEYTLPDLVDPSE